MEAAVDSLEQSDERHLEESSKSTIENNESEGNAETVSQQHSECSIVDHSYLNISSDLSKNSARSIIPCRICHEGETGIEGTISPCCCKGSLGMVHKSCLETWLAESDSSSCEICGHQYTVTRIAKYSCMRSFWRWMRHSSSFGRSHIANRTISIILDGPLVLAVNYLWLKKADHVLEHIDELSFHMLAFVEGEDSFNETLLLASHTANLLLLYPFGVLSGTFLMWYFFRLYDHIRQWYLWHRRQTLVLLRFPESNQ